MKKLLVLLSLFLCVSCSSATDEIDDPVTDYEEVTTDVEETETDPLKVLAPAGATAVPFALAIEEKAAEITIVDGADNLQAAFVNPEPEYDIIVAPTNLGVKLASAGKTDYKLAYVLTWGNLYIVGDKSLDDAQSIAAFGEAAVPGLVYSDLYADYLDKTTFYNSVSDAQAALLTGEADVALLAEPAATATIAKGKESEKDLSIVENVQDKWTEKYGSSYPQAGIFFLESKYDEYEDTNYMELFISDVNDFVTGADADNESVVEHIDAVGADVLGVPSSTIVSKVWPRLNIAITDAAQCQDQILNFVKLFGVEDISAALLTK